MPRSRGITPVKCTATVRRTGKPCGRWAAVGAVVCSSHGGAAPQVQRAAETRLTLAQLMASGRDPRAALLDALGTADGFFRLGKLRLLAGEKLSAEETTEHLAHLQRLAQLAKTAIDARLVDSLTEDRGRHFEAMAQLAQQGIMMGLAALPDLTEAQRAAAIEAMRQFFETAAGERPPEPATAGGVPLLVGPAGGGEVMTPAPTAQRVTEPLSPVKDDDGDVDAEINELRAAITAMKGGPA